MSRVAARMRVRSRGGMVEVVVCCEKRVNGCLMEVYELL